MSENVIRIAEKLAKRDFIVFAGTGVVLSTGAPTWKTMLEKMLEMVNSSLHIENIEPEEYPRIAQQIYYDLKRNSKEELYYKIIKEIITPTKTHYSAEELEIVTTTNWIVTTNFDSTFEEAFEKKFQMQRPDRNLCIETLPNFTMKSHFEEPTIVYLHGKADEKFIVLKEDDYKRYYPSISGEDGARDIEDYLKYIFKEHTIVFIGFSFKDYYIRETFKRIYKELEVSDQIASDKPGYVPKLQTVEHYCFLKKEDNSNYNTLIQELESIKIKVISYSEHIEWVECFKQIQRLRELLGVKNDF